MTSRVDPTNRHPGAGRDPDSEESTPSKTFGFNSNPSVTINRIEDVISFLERPCATGTEKHAHEVTSFYCYAYAGLLTNTLACPLSVTKRDPLSPDFEISMNGRAIGLEITRATHPQYMQVRRIAAQNPSALFFEFPTLAAHERLPREALNQLVLKPGQQLRTSGYMGDQPQNIWRDHMSNAIEAKTKKLNSGNYALYASNELLIFDNTPERGFIDHRSILYAPALDYLIATGYGCDAFPKRFDAVHILSLRGRLHLDVFGENRAVDFPDNFTLPAL